MTVHRKPAATATAVLLAAAVLAGCGAEVTPTASTSAAGYPVTVSNCGAELTLATAPARTVVNDINMTEMMFALGLGNRMAGYTLSPAKAQDAATSPWKDDFTKVPKLGNTPTKELAQGVSADLVYAGWNYGFSDTSGLTPDSLTAVGIQSYQLTEACRQNGTKARGIMDPLDALYTDIANLGKLYDVSDRAEVLLARYRTQLAQVQAAIPANRTPPRVFVYDSGTDQPFSVGRNAAAQDVIAKAGGKNIFDDVNDSWTRVSFESAADRNPQVILINDYGVGPANTVAAKEEFLRKHPLMSNTTAVKEGRFFVLPYAALTEGPRNPQAIVDFAQYLNTLPA